MAGERKAECERANDFRCSAHLRRLLTYEARASGSLIKARIFVFWTVAVAPSPERFVARIRGRTAPWGPGAATSSTRRSSQRRRVQEDVVAEKFVCGDEEGVS